MAALETDSATSKRLGRVRQRDTSSELQVRRYLHGQGVRYRVRNGDLPGSPDMANRRRRWAVFVHGCFWHHHSGCRRATVPRRNRDFWLKKFAANAARDMKVIDALLGMAYLVVVVWECEAVQADALAHRVAPILGRE